MWFALLLYTISTLSQEHHHPFSFFLSNTSTQRYRRERYSESTRISISIYRYTTGKSVCVIQTRLQNVSCVCHIYQMQLDISGLDRMRRRLPSSPSNQNLDRPSVEDESAFPLAKDDAFVDNVFYPSSSSSSSSSSRSLAHHHHQQQQQQCSKNSSRVSERRRCNSDHQTDDDSSHKKLRMNYRDQKNKDIMSSKRSQVLRDSGLAQSSTNDLLMTGVMMVPSLSPGPMTPTVRQRRQRRHSQRRLHAEKTIQTLEELRCQTFCPTVSALMMKFHNEKKKKNITPISYSQTMDQLRMMQWINLLHERPLTHHCYQDSNAALTRWLQNVIQVSTIRDHDHLLGPLATASSMGSSDDDSTSSSCSDVSAGEDDDC